MSRPLSGNVLSSSIDLGYLYLVSILKRSCVVLRYGLNLRLGMVEGRMVCRQARDPSAEDCRFVTLFQGFSTMSSPSLQ